MSHQNFSLEPRGLTRRQAAAYIGVPAKRFDVMVMDGRMPKPKLIDGLAVWDRKKIDNAFEALPETPSNPWDED